MDTKFEDYKGNAHHKEEVNAQNKRFEQSENKLSTVKNTQ